MGSALRTVFIASLCVAASAAHAAAQSAAGGTPVIVTFKSTVDFAPFEREFAADERTQRPTAAYHSRAVLGAVMSLERRHAFRAQGFFSRALQGFSASLTDAQIEALRRNPMVETIEPDEPLSLFPIRTAAQTVDWGIPKVHADQSTAASGDGSGTVTGVNVYVIDTGVDATHPDINLVNHVSFFPGEANADCNGHGTGVAGIIAARDNGDFTVGVAPGAPVTGVKVVGCAGVSTPSLIIQGVDWVTANAAKPAVANISLGGILPINSLNRAVVNSSLSGVFYAVAAGNGNPLTGQAINACYSSPAGAGYNVNNVPNGVATVAATDISDQEAGFSNFGVCVNIWAPGVSVTAPWLMSEGGTITASGTSFASPYVAGGAALLLSRFPTLHPIVVEYILLITADVTGTLSKDGAPIRRLNVRLY
ncbi:MAG TPA: S8 family peptidase [Vicinamibacterales bacterium]|nr:S8 family peptidase [Vicinamibacterales bacterium]